MGQAPTDEDLAEMFLVRWDYLLVHKLAVSTSKRPSDRIFYRSLIMTSRVESISQSLFC